MEISVLSQTKPFPSCNMPCYQCRADSLFCERPFQAHQKPFLQHTAGVKCILDLVHAKVPRLVIHDRSSNVCSNSCGGKGRRESFCKIGLRHVCKALGEDRNKSEGPDENESTPGEEESFSKSAEESGHNVDGNDSFLVEHVEPSTSTDWRTFRARLISMEQLANSAAEAAGRSQEKKERRLADGSWAHPILKPEPGCVLIATEKLDGLSIFERTVILLLSDGLNGSSDGPFGLILNRPLPHTVKDMRPNDLTLIEAFGNSQVHFGGPLVSDLILVHHGSNQAKGYQEVIPGLYFSPAEGLESAAELVREKKSHPEDTRFFFGYAGWAINQLKDETDNRYWYVAACSTDLLMLPSTVNLWKEILCMMGGQYAELSKKPKRRLQ